MQGWWNDILAYSADKPLLFTHLFFWGFFAVVLLGYAFVYKAHKARVIYLLLVSLFFYFKTSGVFLLLLIFTICSDYFWGKQIHKSKTTLQARIYLTCSICLNLFLLCYFKYSYFFHTSFNQITGGQSEFFNHFTAFSNTFFGTSFSVDKLLLPVAYRFLRSSLCHTPSTSIAKGWSR
jgi:alginate O-acetyltransferase complex protein AlgI